MASLVSVKPKVMTASNLFARSILKAPGIAQCRGVCLVGSILPADMAGLADLVSRQKLTPCAERPGRVQGAVELGDIV